MLMAVALQLFTVTCDPFNVTVLVDWVFPNPVPKMVTGLPPGPVVAERRVIVGPGFAVEVTSTLSKVAVASDEVL